MFYGGFNGMTLGDIVNLVYTGQLLDRRRQRRVGVPYLRVFLEGRYATT